LKGLGGEIKTCGEKSPGRMLGKGKSLRLDEVLRFEFLIYREFLVPCKEFFVELKQLKTQ